MNKTAPWTRKVPKVSTPKPLSAAQKRAAKVRAEAAGRRYPNLVDNMWAARQRENGKLVSRTIPFATHANAAIGAGLAGTVR